MFGVSNISHISVCVNMIFAGNQLLERKTFSIAEYQLQPFWKTRTDEKCVNLNLLSLYLGSS